MPPVVLPAFCADRERPRLTCVLPSSQPASDSNRESRSRACRTSATECNAGRPRCECSSLPSFPSFVLLPGPSKKQRTGDKDAITAAAASAAAAVAQAVIQPKDQQMQQLQQQLKEKDEEIQKLSPFPLSFPSLPPSPLSFFSPFLLSLFSRAQWASWDASWRLALQPMGGRGEGKGGFCGLCGCGWGWGQFKPRTKSAEQQQAGSRDRRGPRSWQLKNFGTSITPSTNP